MRHRITCPGARLSVYVAALLFIPLLGSEAVLAVNGGGYLMVHCDPDVDYTPDYPYPDYYIDLFDRGCPSIEPDSCAGYLQWKECDYGEDLLPTYTAEAIAIRNHRPCIFWICAVFPDTSCVELAAADFGITQVEGGVELIDYGAAGTDQMHTDNWPGEGGGLRVWFDPPQTSHVVPLAWIALRPAAQGRVHFGASPWTDRAQFWTSSETPTDASVDYPVAGCILLGHNPVTGIPFSRACCIHSVCRLLAEEECEALGGQWADSPDEYCDPDPCPPAPVRSTTWGGLRLLYRR